ncbi:hypothetical protein GCM10011365_13050 [Marinicella pacifica]|uniref:Galactose oxidase-like protein n=1 Tax=Marinicella pacifica TaxID=1171543 RepID=A0A917CQM1_9GAMM|nr:hypothetical protein [Marinicella pacifica]GGF93202.1 hypothetical protein GCM10011365_13050 [Marinicella pacifica]
MIKHSTQLNLIAFFLIISFSVKAVDDLDQIKIINHNWSELSQDEYIDNLVACELKLQEHKWSKNIWPKENKAPKPAFSEMVDVGEVREKVLNRLYKQTILSEQFHIDINHEMLQYDINRMARNSKDPQSLKAVFSLLDNQPATIAECVSRPYLINNKLHNSFNQHNEIHAETKTLAEYELEIYFKTGETDLSHAQESMVTFKLKADKEDFEFNTRTQELNTETIIEFDEQAFKQKQNELTHQSLQEYPYSFTYTEIIKESENSVSVKNLTWQKQSINQWLVNQEKKYIHKPIDQKQIKLPKISSSYADIDWQTKASTGGQWIQEFNMDGRYFHTAVWTGTEMIVWGGYNGSYLHSGGKYNPVSDVWSATSTSGAPSGRSNHTAVWTGTEMIVWGGYGASFLNSGGKYNPGSDVWMSTSTSGTPDARRYHTAVWTGTEMIVWGGNRVGVGSLNTGGKYNPVSDIWSSTSTSGAPSGRHSHTAVWTGTEMIVWGGYNGSVFNSGGKYNPVSNVWSVTSTSGAPSGRSKHTAVWTGTEMIVWGGYGASYLNSGGKYDPANDIWYAISPSGAPSGRYEHTAVWTGTEMIVWGGTDGSYFNSGGKYNPGSDVWSVTSTSGAPGGRREHVAVWTGTEMIVWGGSGDGGFSNSGGKYNPDSDVWSATSNSGAPIGRYHHTAVWTGSEMIIWGGNNLNSGGKYNPVSDTWVATSTSGAPSGRHLHTAVWTGSEMIIWGGYNYLNTGGKYNPVSDSWVATSTSGAPSGRRLHTAVWTGSEMIIWGGFGHLNTGGKYDPVSDNWVATTTSGAPNGRAFHTAVWTGNEMIIWGGSGDGGFSNSGGKYNPNDDVWVATNTSGAPSGRSGHTAVWTGTEMIVWGGYDGSYSNSGGKYNPASDVWSATSTSSAPGGRYYHTAIWTGTEMIVWGGYGADYLNSGGKYNPDSNVWSATSTSNTPSGRRHHTAIWTGTEMIVWGGEGGTVLGIYLPFNTHTVSVDVSGLASGNSVELMNNGGDNLMVSMDGVATFATALNEGDAYHVTVNTEPTDPNQTCVVTNPIGNINGADVVLDVTCTTNQYDVNVIVSGLAATNSISFVNGGDTAIFSTNTTQTISTLDDGSAFNVSISSAQPDTPDQVCSFTSNNSGNLAGGDYEVTVQCVTTQYNVAVSVSGLAAGNSVSFANGGDTLTLNDNISQVISTLDDGSAFDVNITAQPTAPNQVCGFDNADSGVLNGTHYTVNVTCVTSQYSVGGSVSGLASGNDVVLQNNAGDDLTVSVDGSFVFNSLLDDETVYAVTVLTNPTSPNQSCVVTGGDNNDGTGTLSGSNETGIVVTCTTNQYSVGGSVSGLASGNDVILQNNAGDDLTVSVDGSFVFNSLLDDETVYAVTVLTNPTAPNQTCVITGGTNGDGTGTLAGANETGIIVICETNQYSVGGTVSGLASGNDVVLQNNSTDDLTFSADGSFVFDTQLDDESNYAVTVLTNPTTPNQTCSVSGGTNGDGTGVLAGNDDTSIVVTCETNQYSVGGNVSGLASGNDVVLQNNAGDDLSVLADGSFTFATLLDDESNYAVSVATQPSSPNQQCTVTQGTGTLAGANITDIQVNCVTDVHSIGGTVTGLANNNFVTLSMNAGDEYLVVNSNSAFTFLNPLADGSAYDVSVLSNPTTPNQSCTVINGSGTLQGADITDIEVNCTINQYVIGGYVNGLIPDNFMVLQNNLTDDLIIRNQGAFAFPTPLDDQQSYDVTIQTQPNDPIQSCELINESGSLTGSDVENVFVACEFGDDLIYRHGFDTPEAISRAVWKPED